MRMKVVPHHIHLTLIGLSCCTTMGNPVYDAKQIISQGLMTEWVGTTLWRKATDLLERQLLLRTACIRLRGGGAVRGLAVAGAGAPHAQCLGLEVCQRLL